MKQNKNKCTFNIVSRLLVPLLYFLRFDYSLLLVCNFATYYEDMVRFLEYVNIKKYIYMYLKTANFFSFDRLFLNIKCIHMCMDRIHNSYKGSFCKSPYYVDMGSFQFGLIIFLVGGTRDNVCQDVYSRVETHLLRI